MEIPLVKNLIKNHWQLLILLIIVFLGIALRLGPIDQPLLADYDPWYLYRKAELLLDNNLHPPDWDVLSHFPPGRPIGPRFLGWEYILVIFYKLTSVFTSMTFMRFSMWAPAITAGLIAIPAYLTGKLITNKWGGLATAFFIVTMPDLIPVTMAGYTDTDGIVIFFTFLCIYTTLYALKKAEKSLKKITLYSIPAVISFWLFTLTWSQSWYVYDMFLLFIPAYLVFTSVRYFIEHKKLRIDLEPIKDKIKVLLIIGILGSALCFATSQPTPVEALFKGFDFLSGKALIVVVSVAEMQPLNVFSSEGLSVLTSRIGYSIYLVFLFPILILYRIWKKQEVFFAEIFCLVWFLITFTLITRGVRFASIFSASSAVMAGIIFGTVSKGNFLKNIVKDEEMLKFVKSISIGGILFICLLIVFSVSHFFHFTQEMSLSQNWVESLEWINENTDKDALIVTWWDPGHILTGYTQRRVMADGAHCQIDDCIIYGHNTRIQDMGYAFSTSDENETIQVLRKYMGLNAEQCNKVKEHFGDNFPEEACKNATEMYLIASNDLIGKYHWLSFFGDCLNQFGLESVDVCYKMDADWFKKNVQGRNFIQLPLSRQDAQGNLIYGEIVTLTVKDDKMVPIMNIPQQGIRNAIIKEIIYYQNGQENKFEFGNVTNVMDGLLWVDPSFRIVIFMDPTIRDSVFTNMFFFNGNGDATFDIPKLNHFQLVFQNNEIKIFKVIF